MVGDFDAFVAFDELSNPLIELWYQLGVSVGQRLPVQWFIMFEEANRKQREAISDDTTSDMIENAIQPTKQDNNNNTIKSTERPRRIGKADSKRTRKKKLHPSRHSAAAAAAGLTERKNSSSSSC